MTRYDHPMSAMCACCNQRWGKHYGRLCPEGGTSFVLAAPAEDSEMLALQTRPQHEPASVEEEPQRAPLAWNKSTPFDPFKGAFNDWKFASDCAVESQPDGCFRGLRLDGCGSYRVPKVL